MKKLMNKLVNAKISNSYMFILFGISAVMMAGYFSYAWFTIQGVQQYSIVTGTLSGTVAIGDNSVSIEGVGVINYTPKSDVDIITLTVTNTSDRTVKNSIYYYDPADENIKVGYTSDSSTIPTTTGVSIEKGKSLTYKIGILNSKDKEIRIGSSMGLASANLSLPSGTKAIVNTEDTYCKDNGFTTLADCMLVMNSHETSVETAKTNISAKGTPDFSKTATTDEGLFMAEDDDGASYYYRGAVRNNYVSFAGFIWRIIRQNGDGSIRLIYSGKLTSDTGEAVTVGNSQYNEKYWDPTYVGYKYNEKFSLHESNGTAGYNWFTNTQKYNYGTGYTFDESTKKFTLTGDIKQLTWKDNHDEIVKNNLYSCLNTSCNVVYKITGYSNETTMIVQPISYSSDSYADAVTNTTNSPIKTTLDTWYKNNMTAYTSYLADTTFCNDRSINRGSGYLTTQTTTYGAHGRLAERRTPSLKCSQDNDKFTLTNESAKLDYPVSLITADEASMAGGVLSIANSNYYLYNGQYTWTLSPSIFYSSDSHAYVWSVLPSGDLEAWHYVTSSFGARPVINLKADTQITKGDGTALNPYVVQS